VPSSRITQRYVGVKSHLDLPQITRKQIEHFFVHYKDLEPGKWVKLLGWGGLDETHRLIAAAIERAKRAH
jgi:inorganic pyrophosphatase